MKLPIRNTFNVPSQPPKSDVNKECEKLRGLGDIVAIVAQPVKDVLIKLGPASIKTKLNNCGCEKRRIWMNDHFPFK